MSGPFPVTDDVLDQVEHALSATPEFSLLQLRRFYSGYDESLVRPLLDEDGYEVPDAVESASPCYHPNDIIRALIDEVRRLRQS